MTCYKCQPLADTRICSRLWWSFTELSVAFSSNVNQIN